MSKKRHGRSLSLAGVSLVLAVSTGCQTWVGGMTLPSGHYLQHQPQYFPPSPPFLLPRELASQEAAAAAGVPGAPPAVAGPTPVVPTPATPPAAVGPAAPGVVPQPGP